MLFLGRKAVPSVLSRVSAALSQFIKPIASSNSAETRTRREQPEFKRFDRKREENSPGSSGEDRSAEKHEKKDPRPTAKVIPFPAPEPRAEAPPPTGDGVSVAQSLIQLFTSLQTRRMALLSWMGLKSYQSVANSQRKVGKYRKGAMLDKKVE